MGRAVYDRIADDYAAFVAAGLADPTSVLRLATDALLARADDGRGLTVCDLGCGEGHLARTLAEQGAAVIGVDRSAPLLALARASAEQGGERASSSTTRTGSRPSVTSGSTRSSATSH